jgi:hypothetical protein
MSAEEKILFISHSSKDTNLITLIESAFTDLSVKPYFAKTRIEGKNPVDKIVDAIMRSKAFIVLITPHVVNDNHTRDWVNFEIGVARARKMQIFGWIDCNILQTKAYPRLLENVTTYLEFDCRSDEECKQVSSNIFKIALNLATNDLQPVESTPTIESAEAKKIATLFVGSQPEGCKNVHIKGINLKDGKWEINGSCCGTDVSESNSRLYRYNWTVRIKGKEVIEHGFSIKVP